MGKESRKKIIVIGGGPAGMAAAIAASMDGASVAILEGNPRVGKKLLATGNGRCNYTNSGIEISRYHGKNPGFAKSALGRFDSAAAVDFFERLGVYHREEDGGKIFPMSGQASSVLDVLRYQLKSEGIDVVCDAHADGISCLSDGGFAVNLRDGRRFKSDRIILATGGMAGPQFGSDGSGYQLARHMGHRITEIFPALVQLKLRGGFLKAISGVKFDGTAEVISSAGILRRESGEILFTDYGISGPPILQLSRAASELLSRKERVVLKVMIVDYLTASQLDELIIRRLSSAPKKTLCFSFVGFLNKRLIPVMLKEAGIEDINKPSCCVTADERRSIVRVLKGWEFEVTGTAPWSSAQVTSGGVDLSGINPKTMESKIVPGLYFAGEVIDIDGDCGGYNLQWAWSSGFAAGESAAAD